MANQPTDRTGTEYLRQTANALQGGLTSIPLSTALTTIKAWYQQLQDSGEPQFQDAARELGNLQSLLSSGSAGLNGAAIGRSLSLLGTQTNQLAAHAAPDMQAALHTLGDLLTQAGDGIAT